MGSVSSSAVCSKCRNQDAFNECYYKQGYDITACFRCGRTVEFDQFDGSEKVRGGYGSYTLVLDGYQSHGSFSRRRPAAAHIADLKRRLRRARVKGATVTVRVRGAWKEIAVKGVKSKPLIHRKHYPVASMAATPPQDWSDDDSIPF